MHSNPTCTSMRLYAKPTPHTRSWPTAPQRGGSPGCALPGAAGTRERVPGRRGRAGARLWLLVPARAAAANIMQCVPPSCALTHTRARSLSHARTHTCTRMHSRTRARTSTHARARARTHACTRTHTRARAHTHTRTHVRAHTRARARALRICCLFAGSSARAPAWCGVRRHRQWSLPPPVELRSAMTRCQ